MNFKFDHFRVKYENSGTKIPNVKLTEIGPSFDFGVKRTKVCSDDLYNKSKKQPKEIIVIKHINFFNFIILIKFLFYIFIEKEG